jgi:hypothetical protein
MRQLTQRKVGGSDNNELRGTPYANPSMACSTGTIFDHCTPWNRTDASRTFGANDSIMPPRLKEENAGTQPAS